MAFLRGLLVLLPALASSYAQLKAPSANFPRPPVVPLITAPDEPVVSVQTGATLPPLNTTYYFDQLIDHTDPSLGTFKQRYWHTWEWYEEGQLICRDYATFRSNLTASRRWSHYFVHSR